jgi:hypothetical protein
MTYISEQILFITAILRWSRDSSVGIVTRYGLGRSGVRITVGGEIFRTRPDRLWSPSNLLYNGYRVSFPGVKRPGCSVDHPPNLAPRLMKEYSNTSTPPSGPSWHVLGWNLLQWYTYRWSLCQNAVKHHLRVCIHSGSDVHVHDLKTYGEVTV